MQPSHTARTTLRKHRQERHRQDTQHEKSECWWLLGDLLQLQGAWAISCCGPYARLAGQWHGLRDVLDGRLFVEDDP